MFFYRARRYFTTEKEEGTTKKSPSVRTATEFNIATASLFHHFHPQVAKEHLKKPPIIPFHKGQEVIISKYFPLLINDFCSRERSFTHWLNGALSPTLSAPSLLTTTLPLSLWVTCIIQKIKIKKHIYLEKQTLWGLILSRHTQTAVLMQPVFPSASRITVETPQHAIWVLRSTRRIGTCSPFN